MYINGSKTKILFNLKYLKGEMIEKERGFSHACPVSLERAMQAKYKAIFVFLFVKN